jgi:hypothetical protein
MRVRDFRTWAARPRCGRCLALCLLMLAVGGSGCGGGGHKTKNIETAEVSGKVLFRGKPLPGGRVTFLDSGGAAQGGNIDENGNYKVAAPIGDVKIGVDNRALEPTRERGPKPPVLKRPDADAPETIKGRYVEIPNKYYSPTESGLTYKVVSGAQTYDIKLD